MAATTRRLPLKALLGWAVAALVLLFWARSLRGLPLRDSLAQAAAHPWLLAACAATMGAYVLAQATIWWALVARLATALPLWPALRAWLISTFAAYLPGALWHLAGRVWLGRQHGVSAQVGTMGVLLEQGIQLMAALLLVLAALPLWPAGSLVYPWRALAWLIPLPLLALHPRFFVPLLSAPLRRLGRDPLPRPRYRNVLALLGCYLLAHLANVGALALALHAAGASLAAWPLLLSGGLLAWTLAYFSVVAPGALGVREAAVTLVLGPLVGVGVAAAGALLWRVAHIVAEVALLAAVEVLYRFAPPFPHPLPESSQATPP